jgi:hypothetical protein
VGLRSLDESQRIRSFRQNNSFAGGQPTGGVQAGETTQVRLIVDAGDRDAKMLKNYLYQAYLDQTLRAAGRFEQVGPDKQNSDKVRGIIQRIPKPPQEVPDPSLLVGLGAIAGTLALSDRRKSP